MAFESVARMLQWKNRGRTGSHSDSTRINLSAIEGTLSQYGIDLQDGALLARASEVSDETRYFDWMRKATELRPLQRMYSWLQLKTDAASLDLLTSISDPDSSKFRKLVSQISTDELNGISSSGQPLLHHLCFKQDEKKVAILLQKDIELDQFNSDGLTALHICVQIGWMEGLEMLINAGASWSIPPKPGPNMKNNDFCEKPILTATRNGDSEIVTNFMKKDCDLSVTDKFNNSLLNLACYSHCLPLVERFLVTPELQVKVNHKNVLHETPLHSLFPVDEVLGDYEGLIVQIALLLLQQGSDPNLRNIRGKTALFLAARSGLPLVVKLFLEWGADPLLRSDSGKTVVHAACRAGNVDVLNVLYSLSYEKISPLICAMDDDCFPPFYYAALTSSVDCCCFLLDNGDHLINTDTDGISRFEYANRNMHNGNEMLRRVFDSKIQVHNKSKDDANYQVEMDFSSLISNTEEGDAGQQSLIDDFDDSKAYQLLSHPLVESFLYLKWHKIRLFFYSHVIIYAVFLFIHSFYVVKTFCMNTDWTKEKAMYDVLYAMHIVLLLILAVFGVLYIVADLRKYVKQFETYFNLTAIVTSALVVFSDTWGIHDSEVTRNIASISIFMCWIEFMMLLGRIPALGFYVFMFTRVSLSVIKFVWPFTSLILAFTLAFSVLFHQSPIFQMPIGLVKTLMMMIGEMDYGDIFEMTMTESVLTRTVGHCFLVVFLFLMPILFANLLIGLAVNDLPDLQKHGHTRRLVKQASYLVSYEQITLLLRFVICWKFCPFRRLIRRSTIPDVIIFSTNESNCDLPKELLYKAIELKQEENGGNEFPDNTNLEELLIKTRQDQKRMEKKMDEILKILENFTKPESATKIPKRRSIKKC